MEHMLPVCGLSSPLLSLLLGERKRAIKKERVRKKRGGGVRGGKKSRGRERERTEVLHEERKQVKQIAG